MLVTDDSLTAELGRTGGFLPLWEACMVTSCSVKAQGRAFRSVLTQGSLGSDSEVHGIFSDRDLPSTPGESTKGNSNKLWELQKPISKLMFMSSERFHLAADSDRCGGP